ncbi:Gp138 family membrane-puncturing spike protein [Rhizobium leguminosarum]|uniref:Gp138 family membrane-puncturing spike protein n=1 Tax=Rhizobium leguminosarum TaxID=384 RepID=UPI0003FD5203|nr:Gp138 family membrane-puncturing spike protein [Rhizobium leguminosarum]
MTEGYFGQRGITDSTSETNAIQFLIRQAMGEVRTGIPVKIIAVHGGGVGAAPTVDVQPVVTQIDGQGNQTPHGIIYGIPVSRSQGGAAGIIMDPVVGDVGHMVISDRDTSALRSNKGDQSNPGSFRMHDPADGVYHGAMLNPVTPNRYINMNGPGITLADEFGNTIITGAAGILINGVLIDRTGKVTAPSDVIANPGNISLVHHVNTDVLHGSDDSGPPKAS